MFADVRRDEDRPFIVSADRLEVKVKSGEIFICISKCDGAVSGRVPIQKGNL